MSPYSHALSLHGSLPIYADQRPAAGGKEPGPGWQSLCECDVQIHREIITVNGAARHGTTAPVGISPKNGQYKGRNMSPGECSHRCIPQSSSKRATAHATGADNLPPVAWPHRTLPIGLAPTTAGVDT